MYSWLLNQLPGIFSVQIVTLTKKNRMLAQKCKENITEVTLLNNKIAASEGELKTTKVMEEMVSDSSPTQTKVSSCGVLF